MSVTLQLGDWTRLGPEANAIRFTVFVDEQKVPASLENDEFDAVSIHAVASDGGQPCGTGRLLPDGHIGRMAVLAAWRGKGIGGRILTALIEAARARGDAQVVLNSQLQAMPFYEGFGFAAEGDEFMEAGIAHRTMTLAL
ncbi:GNAT family N-acetyltransferase [soil metagenome]